jgi:Ca2+-binding RTX toxin-like protein
MRSSADTTIEFAGQGTDTVNSSVSFVLSAGQEIENLTLTGSANIGGTGNGLANVLTGNSGNNTLDGGGGADTLQGGAGNDTYVVDNDRDKVIEVDGNGTDLVQSSVTFRIESQGFTTSVENLTLTGSADINADGGRLDNTIIGNSGDNRLFGAGGNDTLDGGGGFDVAVYSDKTGAVVVTLAGASSATVFVAGVAEDTISNIEGVRGGLGDDTLTGDAFANLLDGGANADTLNGGGGNDTYVVDSTGDKVIETEGNGTDVVETSASFSIRGEYVEDLTLTEPFFTSPNINATGNALDNTIIGNSGDNFLDGGARDDKLQGDAGDDTLSGGKGADTMQGGVGNDIYLVDNAGDEVIEADGEGTDLVESSCSFSLAGEFVENLTLTGTAANASGNSLDNTLAGNSGNNTLTGAEGADTFTFNTALNAASNVDHVTDFASVDTIGLDNAVFTALSTLGTLAASAFYSAAGATSAHDSTDRIVYNTTTGALFYDVDGVGGAAAVEFAVIDNHAALTNADFVVV